MSQITYDELMNPQPKVLLFIDKLRSFYEHPSPPTSQQNTYLSWYKIK